MKRQEGRILREKARQLRWEGKSLNEIVELLSVAKSTLSGWVRDIELTPEQVEALKQNQRLYGAQNKGAGANRKKARDERQSYHELGREHARNGSRLHLTGCMLYWAEGAKKRNVTYFVSSDPNMMLIFMRFLREEMGVIDDICRIHIHCHTYNSSEIRRIERYWLDLLQLPDSCLRKTQIKQGSNTRKNVLENGVCGLAVYSTELTHRIYGAIQEYGGFDNPDWLF